MSATGQATKVEIVGPFQERKLVVDNWSVPLMTACEVDGGKVALCLDHRFEILVEAGQFDDLAWFLANTVAACLGYSCHPSGEIEDHRAHFARVPHPSLAPRRMMEIEAAS